MTSRFYFGKDRLLLLISAVIYVLAFFFAYIFYLNTTWEYWGFSWNQPKLLDIIYMSFHIFIVTMLLPTKIDSAGNTALFILYSIVFVPTVIITSVVKPNGIFTYGMELLALTVSFSLSCIGVLFASKHKYNKSTMIYFRDNKKLAISIWIAMTFILIITYSKVMTLSSLETIYEQRAATASSSTFISYIKTYYGYFFSPLILAIGLSLKRPTYSLLGFSGFILLYSISAERTVFLMPFLMLTFYIIQVSKRKILKKSYFYLFFISLVFIFTSIYFRQNHLLLLIATYGIFRTFSLPGLSFSLYSDLFEEKGFTYWTHVKGVSSLISTPEHFTLENTWPQLGYIVGKYVYNSSENNYNANFYSGDGAAALGWAGIMIIGILFTLWIYTIERLSTKWNPITSILMLLPITIVLTNGHFFTAMISFGGIPLFLFLKYCGDSRKATNN